MTNQSGGDNDATSVKPEETDIPEDEHSKAITKKFIWDAAAMGFFDENRGYGSLKQDRHAEVVDMPSGWQ